MGQSVPDEPDEWQSLSEEEGELLLEEGEFPSQEAPSQTYAIPKSGPGRSLHDDDADTIPDHIDPLTQENLAANAVWVYSRMHGGWCPGWAGDHLPLYVEYLFDQHPEDYEQDNNSHVRRKMVSAEVYDFVVRPRRACQKTWKSLDSPPTMDPAAIRDAAKAAGTASWAAVAACCAAASVSTIAAAGVSGVASHAGAVAAAVAATIAVSASASAWTAFKACLMPVAAASPQKLEAESSGSSSDEAIRIPSTRSGCAGTRRSRRRRRRPTKKRPKARTKKRLCKQKRKTKKAVYAAGDEVKIYQHRFSWKWAKDCAREHGGCWATNTVSGTLIKKLNARVWKVHYKGDEKPCKSAVAHFWREGEDSRQDPAVSAALAALAAKLASMRCWQFFRAARAATKPECFPCMEIITEPKPKLSSFERGRNARIAENRKVLNELGLSDAKERCRQLYCDGRTSAGRKRVWMPTHLLRKGGGDGRGTPRDGSLPSSPAAKVVPLRRGRSGSAAPVGLCCGNPDCEKRPLETELKSARVCDVCDKNGITAYTCKKCDEWDVCAGCASGGKQAEQVTSPSGSNNPAASLSSEDESYVPPSSSSSEDDVLVGEDWMSPPAEKVPALQSTKPASSSLSSKGNVLEAVRPLPAKKTRRRARCKVCTGCKKPNCGSCRYCLDMKCNGGRGTLRRPCMQRMCVRHRDSSGSSSARAPAKTPTSQKPAVPRTGSTRALALVASASSKPASATEQGTGVTSSTSTSPPSPPLPSSPSASSPETTLQAQVHNAGVQAMINTEASGSSPLHQARAMLKAEVAKRRALRLQGTSAWNRIRDLSIGASLRIRARESISEVAKWFPGKVIRTTQKRWDIMYDDGDQSDYDDTEDTAKSMMVAVTCDFIQLEASSTPKRAVRRAARRSAASRSAPQEQKSKRKRPKSGRRPPAARKKVAKLVDGGGLDGWLMQRAVAQKKEPQKKEPQKKEAQKKDDQWVMQLKEVAQKKEELLDKHATEPEKPRLPINEHAAESEASASPPSKGADHIGKLCTICPTEHDMVDAVRRLIAELADYGAQPLPELVEATMQRHAHASGFSPWTFIKKLKVPIKNLVAANGRVLPALTHCCLICTAKNPVSWRLRCKDGGALMRMAGGRAKTGNASSHMRKHLDETTGLVNVWTAARARRLQKRKLDMKELVSTPAAVKRVRVHASDLPRRAQRQMQVLMVRALVAHDIAPRQIIKSKEWNSFVGGPNGLLPEFVSPAWETYVQILEDEYAALVSWQKAEWAELRSEYGACTKFLHIQHDVWTSPAGRKSVLGYSATWLTKKGAKRCHPLGFAMMPDGHSAAHCADAVRRHFRRRYGFGLQEILCTVSSDTTAGAANVAEELGLRTNANCQMHVGNLILGYTVCMKQNTRTAGDRYTSGKNKGKKIQRIVTACDCPCKGKLPDGQECSDPHCGHVCSILCVPDCPHGTPAPGTGPLVIIKKARALVNVINTGTHRAQLEKLAADYNFKYVAPQLDGETRVSGITIMFRSLLVLRLLLIAYLPKFTATATRGATQLIDVMLTDSDWGQMAELLAIAEKVSAFNTVVQTSNTCIGPLGIVLRVWLSKAVRGTFLVVNWRLPVHAGTPIGRLPTREVRMEDLEHIESRHTVRRLRAQVRRYLGPDSVTDADLIAMAFSPRCKMFLWQSQWCKDASWLLGDMKKLRRRAKRLMEEEITTIDAKLNPSDGADALVKQRSPASYSLQRKASQDIVDSSDDEGGECSDEAPPPSSLDKALRRMRRFRQYDFTPMIANAFEDAGIAPPNDEDSFIKALLRLPAGNVICNKAFVEAWPLCSRVARARSAYSVASSVQEGQFSRGKLVLAYQRLLMGDKQFERTAILGSTMAFQHEKRQEEEDEVKAKAAEEHRTPSPAARASSGATAIKVAVRPAKASLAELDKRLAARRPLLVEPGSEHRLIRENREAALRIKKLLRDFSASLASPLSRAAISRYVVGLLKSGMTRLMKLAGVDSKTLVHKADMSRHDAEQFLKWLRRPSVKRMKTVARKRVHWASDEVDDVL